MKNKKIYVSLILWAFPAYFVIIQSNLAWQSIVIALCVTVILNLDRFKSIGYGDVHAVLNDADEKLKTIEELSEVMFLESVRSLFASNISFILDTPREYETPSVIQKYIEIADLKEELKIKQLRNSSLKTLKRYKNKSISSVQENLYLAIEFYSSKIENIDIKNLYKNKIDRIFNIFIERDFLDTEYSSIVRNEILSNENVDEILLTDWNLAMHDLNRINEATKRLS